MQIVEDAKNQFGVNWGVARQTAAVLDPLFWRTESVLPGGLSIAIRISQHFFDLTVFEFPLAVLTPEILLLPHSITVADLQSVSR